METELENKFGMIKYEGGLISSSYSRWRSKSSLLWWTSKTRICGEAKNEKWQNAWHGKDARERKREEPEGKGEKGGRGGSECRGWSSRASRRHSYRSSSDPGGLRSSQRTSLPSAPPATPASPSFQHHLLLFYVPQFWLTRSTAAAAKTTRSSNTSTDREIDFGVQ